MSALHAKITKSISSITYMQILTVTFDVSIIHLKSDRRDEHSSKPRHAFCWLCFECTYKTSTQIGKFLKRDHTTVLHSLKRATQMRREDEHFYNITETLKKQYLKMWR